MNKQELESELERIKAINKQSDRLEELKILKVKLSYLTYRQLRDMHLLFKDKKP